MTYATYLAMMDGRIRPLGRARPGDRRLDGQTSGGNRATVATFNHDGRTWKVHADTHYEPMEIAARAIESGRVDDPFVVETTKAGVCLVLRDDLRALYRSPHKHLYIYEVGQ